MDGPVITVREYVNDVGQRMAEITTDGDGIFYCAKVQEIEPRKPLIFPKTIDMARMSVIKAWFAMKVTGAKSLEGAWSEIHKSKTLYYRYMRALHAYLRVSA